MSPRQRYCSVECYRKSPKPRRRTGQTFSCSVCGEQVYVNRARLGLEHYFCCLAHANEWQGRNKITHKCIVCGVEFKWSPSRIKNNNVKYCSLTCRDKDPERHTLLLQMNVKQQQGETTTPERIGYDILNAMKIEYLPQHVLFNKFCVDAFIPSLNVVVQFDGDYWHGNPQFFHTLDTRQQKRVRLDRSQDAYMQKCGVRVIRIWETDLRRERVSVKERLLIELVPIKQTPSAQE